MLHGAGKQSCTHQGVIVDSHEIVTQIKGLRETVQFWSYLYKWINNGGVWVPLPAVAHAVCGYMYNF